MDKLQFLVLIGLMFTVWVIVIIYGYITYVRIRVRYEG